MKISVVNFSADPVEREHEFPPNGDMYFFRDDPKNEGLQIRDVHVTSRGVLIYAEKKRSAR